MPSELRPNRIRDVSRRRRGPRSVALGTVLAAGLVAAACGDGGSGGGSGAPAAPGGATVLATTSILADVASQVTCGEVEVAPLVPRGADAHEFEPDVRDADRLAGADLVVANGLGLEEGLADTLDRARSGGVEVFEVAPELDPLPAGEGDEHAGDEDHAGDDEHADDGGHDHGDLDPHVWMDPVRMADAAELIGARLADVEGLGVPPARLERCTADYAQRLRGVAEEAAATLAAVPAERRKLVTDHESLAYFADRFDLEVVGAAIPSTSSLGEPNARDLEDLAEVVRATGVPAVFASVDGSDDVAQALADRVGGDVAVVSLHLESLDEPGAPAGTYEGMVRTNAALVADALAGRRG